MVYTKLVNLSLDFHRLDDIINYLSLHTLYYTSLNLEGCQLILCH